MSILIDINPTLPFSAPIRTQYHLRVCFDGPLWQVSFALLRCGDADFPAFLVEALADFGHARAHSNWSRPPEG